MSNKMTDQRTTVDYRIKLVTKFIAHFQNKIEEEKKKSLAENHELVRARQACEEWLKDLQEEKKFGLPHRFRRAQEALFRTG